MLSELTSLYASGEKADRVKADALIWEHASEFDLPVLVATLLDPHSTITSKMVAALAVGYHQQSSNKELRLLFEVLEDSEGDSTNYVYRILAGIRKLLKHNTFLIPEEVERFDSVIAYYRLQGGDDTKQVAATVYGLMHYGEISTTMFVKPVFPKPSKDPQYRCEIFVVMPFANTFLAVFKDAIEPVCKELGLSVKRGDDFSSSSHIIDEVWFGIYNSRIVIVDCTGNNPNVFYELGVAHTLGRPTILLSQDLGRTSFDIRSRRLINYENDPMAFEELKHELKEAIKMVLKEIHEQG